MHNAEPSVSSVLRSLMECIGEEKEGRETQPILLSVTPLVTIVLTK